MFSRSFFRRRAISGATTLAVTAASLAFGHSPHAVHPVRLAATAQHASAPQGLPEMPVLQAAKFGGEPARPCDRRVHTFEATTTSPPPPSSG